MQDLEPNYYATLGLHNQCTAEQIRTAYRLLAKQFHPDVNSQSQEALSKTQALNAAYEILSDPDKRRAYDQACAGPKQRLRSARGAKQNVERNLSQNVFLRLDEFLRGTSLEVQVNDPANPDGLETYQLIIPPETAPGTRLRVPRTGYFEGGHVLVQLRPRPDFRFKVSGSDLRCDLRISLQRAAQGGTEMVQSLSGRIRIDVPRGVGRGEIICVAGQGLPKTRGGRGDLLVRIQYRPEVQISRS